MHVSCIGEVIVWGTGCRIHAEQRRPRLNFIEATIVGINRPAQPFGTPGGLEAIVGVGIARLKVRTARNGSSEKLRSVEQKSGSAQIGSALRTQIVNPLQQILTFQRERRRDLGTYEDLRSRKRQFLGERAGLTRSLDVVSSILRIVDPLSAEKKRISPELASTGQA